jgi:phosphoglycerate kinase
MKKLSDLNLKNKRVLVRVDFNVPMDDNLNVTDDTRIKMVLPTIEHIASEGGICILMSHCGRPEGKVIPELSLRPAGKRLAELLKRDVRMATDCIGTTITGLISELKSGDVVLLENLRFYKGEEDNDQNFAKELAKLGDVFVNDAFATAHRASASMVGICKFVAERAPGLLMQKEMDYFDKALLNPKRPLCVVLGGAKVSTKLPTLQNIVKIADKVIIGGAMANTFLAAQGIQMGRSLYEPDLFPKVMEIVGALARRDGKLYLPVDFRIGTSPKAPALSKPVTAQDIPADTMALDIGPATSILFEQALADAETIVWNGPVGCFENEDFAQGTNDLTRAMASAHGLTLAGGGDTIAAINSMELAHRFDYISTGGGAFLELLEGKELPGIVALR